MKRIQKSKVQPSFLAGILKIFNFFLICNITYYSQGQDHHAKVNYEQYDFAPTFFERHV